MNKQIKKQKSQTKKTFYFSLAMIVCLLTLFFIYISVTEINRLFQEGHISIDYMIMFVIIIVFGLHSFLRTNLINLSKKSEQ